MSQLTLTVEQAGQRADQFLAQTVDTLTRSGAQKLLEQGRVTVNGKAAKKNTKFSAGDTVIVQLPEPEPVEVLPQNIPLDVVYEDQDVIVVNKPVGMVVHPAPATQMAPWSTPCSTPAAIPSPASTASCGQVLSTVSTETPADSSSRPKTIWLT